MESGAPAESREVGCEYAGRALDYLEGNAAAITPNTSMVRQCIEGLKSVLASSDQQERIRQVERRLLPERSGGWP